MSSFLEKVRNGFTLLPNQLLFLMTDGVIDSSELIFMTYVLMMNEFRKHKTSRTQLEKVLRMRRQTISQIIKNLEAKGLIEVEQCGLFIIIHSNITMQTRSQIILKTKEKEAQEIEEYNPDDDFQPGPQPHRLEPQPGPQPHRLPGPQTDTIERRYITKIENKDISRELELASDLTVSTPNEKQQKEHRKEVKAAYQKAFVNRYGVNPLIDNPKSHSLIKNLVKQVGYDTAIKLCYEYLKSNDSYAVKERHPLSLLIQNPTKFIVDNKIGRVTLGDQKNIDLKEANERSYRQWLASKGETR